MPKFIQKLDKLITTHEFCMLSGLELNKKYCFMKKNFHNL